MNDARWRPKTSPYQYWFFKVNTTPLALLVDWVLRPERSPHLRVSVQGVAHPRVSWHEGSLQQAPGEAWVCIGDVTLGPTYTCGAAGDVRWDLRVEPWGPVLDPLEQVSPALRPVVARLPLDMRILSLPAVRFQGTLSYQGQTWTINAAPGAVTHYWGRRLPERWLWVNASGCDRTDTAVEALLVCTRLGRMSWFRLWTGYFWLWQDRGEGGSVCFYLHPLTGHLDLRGPAHAPMLRVIPWHGTGYIVRCRAHPKAWQKLGDEIINTLVGDCRVLGVTNCLGTAGIEWRRPPVL